MTHTYTINGMTCNGCQANVQQRLSGVKGIKTENVNLDKKRSHHQYGVARSNQGVTGGTVTQ
jgi:copper chaperone CopZ